MSPARNLRYTQRRQSGLFLFQRVCKIEPEIEISMKRESYRLETPRRKA